MKHRTHALVVLLGLAAVAACAPTKVATDLDAFNTKVKKLVDDFNGDIAGISQGLNDLATIAQNGSVVTLQMAQKGCGAASILNGFYQVAASISPKVAATAGDETKAMNATNALCSTPATDPASTLKVAISTIDTVKASVKQIRHRHRAPGGLGAAGVKAVKYSRRSGAAALLLMCAGVGLSGCTAAATAALGVALNIGVKATELDTAIIENIKARTGERKSPAEPTPPSEEKP